MDVGDILWLIGNQVYGPAPHQNGGPLQVEKNKSNVFILCNAHERKGTELFGYALPAGRSYEPTANFRKAR